METEKAKTETERTEKERTEKESYSSHMEKVRKARNKSDILKKIFIYATLIFFLLVAVMPIVWMLLAALKGPDDVSQNPFAFPTDLSLHNFFQAWTVGNMDQYFLNSVIVAIPRVAVILVLASLAGYAFGKLKFPGQNFLFYFFLFGMMVPIQAMVIPLYHSLQAMNLIDTYWAMIIPFFGIEMPFAIFMMRAFFRDLPNELMDSAKVDGCNSFTTFWYVMLPLVRPALASLLVIEFVWAWNEFFIPLLVVYDDAFRPLPLGLMFFSGEYTTNQALVAAGVAISTIPVIIVYLFFQRKLIEGLTSGSVKG